MKLAMLAGVSFGAGSTSPAPEPPPTTEPALSPKFEIADDLESCEALRWSGVDLRDDPLSPRVEEPIRTVDAGDTKGIDERISQKDPGRKTRVVKELVRIDRAKQKVAERMRLDRRPKKAKSLTIGSTRYERE